jgi:hypothetical protein
VLIEITQVSGLDISANVILPKRPGRVSGPLELIGAKARIGPGVLPSEKSGQWRSLSFLVTV